LERIQQESLEGKMIVFIANRLVFLEGVKLFDRLQILLPFEEGYYIFGEMVHTFSHFNTFA
jgi:hypothetical protein